MGLNMPYYISTNQRDNIEVSKIYSVEKKRWGSVWVRYFDKNKNKKISKSRTNIVDLCCNINIFRQIEGLEKIIPKIEE